MSDILPGGPIATRPLHFIFIADCSGSMAGEKIQSLNHAISEAIPHMRDVAEDNPNASVLVRAIKFASGASWHVSQETPVENFQWPNLSTYGCTDMGKAMRLLADALDIPPMSERALPPVLVLISDGEPTDDFNSGLQAMMSKPWGKKAVRLAIAIGQRANKDVLQRFIGHPEIQPLEANNSQDLVKFIKWASTVGLKAASAPASQLAGNQTGMNVPIPQPPSQQAPTLVDPNDVW
jgi:uncharacterized protein YegL